MALQWSGEAIILSIRPLQERKVIITTLCLDHGLTRGVAYKTSKMPLDVGLLIHGTWKARLEDQLPQLTVEPLRNPMTLHRATPMALTAALSALELCWRFLPQRHPYPTLFQALQALLDQPTADALMRSYCQFELLLLQELGYGLDLRRCAVTGVMGPLAYVSPKSGQAVTLEGARGYESKLFPLPVFLTDVDTPATSDDWSTALQLTGHFIDTRLNTHAPRVTLLQRNLLIAAIHPSVSFPTV